MRIDHRQALSGFAVIHANAEQLCASHTRYYRQNNDFGNNFPCLSPGCRVAPLAWRRIGLGYGSAHHILLIGQTLAHADPRGIARRQPTGNDA